MEQEFKIKKAKTLSSSLGMKKERFWELCEEVLHGGEVQVTTIAGLMKRCWEVGKTPEEVLAVFYMLTQLAEENEDK